MKMRLPIKGVIGLAISGLAALSGTATADPVEVRYATGYWKPSSTGGASYTTKFELLVDNIAYEKTVGVWGESHGFWNFHPGTYVESVPGNREVWRVDAGPIDRFVAKYEVAGNTYWDNNSGYDYDLEMFSDSKMIGKPNLIHGGSQIDESGDLLVTVGVKNLEYQKEVGIVYTTDDWATANTAFAYYEAGHEPSDHPGQPQAETWQIVAPVGGANTAEFAIFYRVDGSTYWDNNFGRNFTATRD